MSKPFKHIAVFLRGHMRTYKDCMPASFEFYDSISENVDYYLTTWNTIPDTKKAIDFFKDKNLVYTLFNSKETVYYTGDNGPSYQLYQMMPYKRKREKELNYKYDVIFDTRPDVIPTLRDTNISIEPNTIYTHLFGSTIQNNQTFKHLEDYCLCMDNDLFESWADRYINQSRINCQVEPILWAEENNIEIKKVEWYSAEIKRPLNNNTWDRTSDDDKITICREKGIPIEDYACSASPTVKIKEKRKIIFCGDSWAWGAELFPPNETNPLTVNHNELYSRPDYLEYRLKNRYQKKLSDFLGVTDTVDLSNQSISNDTIYRYLLEYLASEGYLSGRNTSELFVSIGWTSPERTEFYYKEKWGHDNYIEVGPWSLNMDHFTQCSDDVKKFLRLYCENFWEPGGFLHRYIVTLYNTQLLLKTFNIKYVMHQAFYHHFLPPEMPRTWDDKKYRKKFDHITPGDRRLWSLLDEKRFMYLNNPETGTFHHFIIKHVGNDHNRVLEGWHPNALGHEIWTNEMYRYILQNELL